MLSVQDMNVPQGPHAERYCNCRIPFSFPIVINGKGNKELLGSKIASDSARAPFSLLFRDWGNELCKIFGRVLFLWCQSFKGEVKRLQL